MFEAFVIVCAANFANEVDYASCFRASDEWGPYISQENCDIRINQMMNEILRGELNPVLFELFRSQLIPIDQLYAEGYCNKLKGERA